MPLGNINVLQLVLSFRRGGRRNAITNLAAELGDGINCHLCCLDELGCEVHELRGLFRSLSVLNRGETAYFPSHHRLACICREREIDVIHAHDAASQYMGALARMARPKTRLLMTFHRTLGFESARRRDKVRNAFCGLFSEAIVTGSAERKRHYLAENLVSGRKLLVIPFGVDLDRFEPEPQSRAQIRSQLGIQGQTVVIGTIGHLGIEKGVDQAVRAFNNLSIRHPDLDVALVILGDGTPDQRNQINRLSRQNTSRRIVLAGFQPDVNRWLSAFDVLLHTPRMEAFGLAVTEAMACGVPVVATGVGSLPEIVRDGQTGLVVQAESVDAIGTALARIIRDNDLRQTLASRARQVAQREYSSTLYASRYAELYRQIVAARSGAGDPRLTDQPVSPRSPHHEFTF